MRRIHDLGASSETKDRLDGDVVILGQGGRHIVIGDRGVREIIGGGDARGDEEQAGGQAHSHAALHPVRRVLPQLLYALVENWPEEHLPVRASPRPTAPEAGRQPPQRRRERGWPLH
ncbi:MAG: hypothetical protein R2939_19075 [Kofleriaceae bacterium]